MPVRLMKRELLFIALQMAAKLDLPRMEILAKLHQLTAQKGKEPLPKTVVAFIRRSGEGMLGRLLVEMAVLLRADSEQAASKVLAEAAKEYEHQRGRDQRGSEQGVCRAGKGQDREEDHRKTGRKGGKEDRSSLTFSIAIPTEPANTGSNFFGQLRRL